MSDPELPNDMDEALEEAEPDRDDEDRVDVQAAANASVDAYNAMGAQFGLPDVPYYIAR